MITIFLWGKRFFETKRFTRFLIYPKFHEKKKFLVFDENKNCLPYYVRRIFFGKHFPHSFRPDIFRTTNFIS